MKLYLLSLALLTSAFAQNWPKTWSPSYGTYDLADVFLTDEYGIGLSLNNYCIYNHPDSTSYDERRFDLWARLGILKNAEFELKYSYPTCGLVSLKYKFFEHFVDAAFKFGFGYMKGTREDQITDYVYDFYPTLLLSKTLLSGIRFFMAPKLIYSIHTRDTQEHSTRPPREIFHYGYGLGCAVGKNFQILPEANWCWGNNEGVKYMVNQFGMGVALKIK